MKKFLLAICTAMLCIVAVLTAACGGSEVKQPEKLKDGIALTLTEGESKNIDLSEYISIEGSEYAYEATSSQQNIATVAVEGNIAKVTAVSEGNATVTASAGEVSVDFAVTVNKKQPTAPVEVDKSALEAELVLEVSEQGDYTEESYAAYVQKLEAAKAVNAKADATQTEVDTACDELETARLALALRVPQEVDGAEKTLVIVSGRSIEITVSDYIDGKNLSQLTYEVSSGNALVTVSEITEGKFTVTAGETEENIDVDLDICAKYKGESKLTVTITLQVKSDPQPVVKHSHITQSVDIYTLENKNELTIDFTENVESNGVESLAYSVKLNGADVTLNGNNSYAFPLTGSYGETATDAVFSVTVSYGEGKSVGYEYTLKITDTTSYRIVNGGFETGDLTGWTLSNPDLGGVNNNETYWAENIPFNNDGNFFNAYYFDGEAKESATGTLTSSPFTVGGTGWITYKLGAAKNIETVTLEIVSAADETKRVVLPNFDWSDVGGNTQVRGCTLVAYKANLLDYGFDNGESVYILVTDNAASDYGLFFLDSVVTYYPQEPVGDFNLVAPTRLFNGGFESGLSGWTVETTEDNGGDFGFWSDNAGATWGDEANPKSYNNDGKFFQNGCEGSKGYLLSSVFEVSQNGWITFKLGGNKALNYVAIVDAETDEVLAKFVNEHYVGAWPNNGWEMYAYKANLVESGIAAGRKVRIKVVDDSINDYGVVVVDSFVTLYGAEPDGEFTKVNNTL